MTDSDNKNEPKLGGNDNLPPSNAELNEPSFIKSTQSEPAPAASTTQFQNEIPISDFKPRSEGALDPIRDYFIKVWKIATHPSDFFKSLSGDEPVSSSLAFGVIAHWIGTAVASLFFATSTPFLLDKFKDFSVTFDQSGEITNQFMLLDVANGPLQWVFGTGRVVLDPFFTAFSVLISAVFIFVGVKFFATSVKENQFSLSLKIAAYALAPTLFLSVHIFGGLSLVWSSYIAWIGIREVFKLDSMRALGVLILPRFVFYFGLFMLAILFFASIIGILVAVLSGISF